MVNEPLAHVALTRAPLLLVAGRYFVVIACILMIFLIGPYYPLGSTGDRWIRADDQAALVIASTLRAPVPCGLNPMMKPRLPLAQSLHVLHEMPATR